MSDAVVAFLLLPLTWWVWTHLTELWAFLDRVVTP